MSDQYRTSLRDAADWGLVALAAVAAAALTQPIGAHDGAALSWMDEPMAVLFLIGTVLAVAAGRTAPSRRKGAIAEIGGAALAWLLPLRLAGDGVALGQAWGVWLYLLGATAILLRALRRLAR